MSPVTRHLIIQGLLLQLIYTQVAGSQSTACNKGEYNDGGYCEPCWECPDKNIHEWIEKACCDAFVDPLKVCHPPTNKPHFRVSTDRLMCAKFVYGVITTTAATSPLEDITTPDQNVTPSGAVTQGPGPYVTQKDKHHSVNTDNGDIMAQILVIVIVTLFILVGIIIGIVAWCFKPNCRRKTNTVEKGYYSDARSIEFQKGFVSRYEHVVLICKESGRIIDEKSVGSDIIRFSLEDNNLLPNMTYKVELSGNGEKKTMDVSTEALKFSGICKEKKILLQDVEDISSKFPMSYKTCCSQIEPLKDNNIGFDSYHWNSMQVQLFVKNGNFDHLIGEEQIINSGHTEVSQTCSFKPKDCITTELKTQLKLVNPEYHHDFCMKMIHASNKLSNDAFGGYFEDGIITQSGEFWSEYVDIFKYTNLAEMNTFDFLESIKNKMPQHQMFGSELENLGKAFMECHTDIHCHGACCKTFIHSMHELDLPVIEFIVESSSECSSEVSSSSKSSIPSDSNKSTTSIEQPEICDSGTFLLTEHNHTTV